MKAVFAFIAEHGFTLMLGGVMTIIAGIAAYMTINVPRFAGTPYPTVAVVIVFIGFAIYVVGRVSVAVQRKRTYERGSRTAADDDE